MSNLCFIPARGGSQRIKDKNLSVLNSRTLLDHSIYLARDSGLFDHVVVSTDSQQIKDAAYNSYGDILVHDRPDHLATNYSQIEDSLLDFLESNQLPLDIVSNICILQCTNPFTSHIKLSEAMSKLSEYNSVVYGFELSPFLWNISHGKLVNPFYNIFKRPRTQDSEKFFFETGAMYCFRADKFLVQKNRIIEPVSFVIEDPQIACHDINYESDLSHARKLAKALGVG